MKGPDRYLTFATREEWRAWLEEHHARDREAWLLHSKKGASWKSLPYEGAVEEALCFGWIDGLLRSVDGETFALRYSPRKARSIWSASNKRRAERLIDEGRMAPAGLEKIAQARENGEWDAATAREDVESIPDDLAQALEESQVLAAFRAWPASRRQGLLYWLSSARKPETRARRMEAIVAMATARR